MPSEILTAATALRPSLVADRRLIHQHPELPYQEERTSAYIAGRLKELGIEHRSGIAETGIIGLIPGAASGKTVLLRADMDALPIEEISDQPYASQNRGVMHACGHDGHVAMLLAAAQILQQRKGGFRGNVKLMFQPAEEGGAGALKMINEGILEEPYVDAVFGLHLAGLHYTGQTVINDGPAMAAADHLHIFVRGRGGHASTPHVTVDPIIVAAHIVTALQTMVSRESPPLEPAVVTIANIQGGNTFNVIPDFVEMKGTVRTFSAALQNRLKKRIPELVRGIATAMGATAEVEYGRLYPATINHNAEAAFMRASAASAIGAERIVAAEPVMGAEDFSYLLQQRPGAFGHVGVRRRDWTTPRGNHNSSFDMDEDALPIGAAVLAETALKYLEQD